MNILGARPDALDIIRTLGAKRVDGKRINYELTSGIDFRRMNDEVCQLLKENKFVKPRIAWDFGLEFQYKIKDAIERLLKVGYKRKEIYIFVVVNWKIPYNDCLKKLDLLKVWNVKVNDCCWDGGYKVMLAKNNEGGMWTIQQLKEFRSKCRKHNQLVLFGIDPELKKGNKNV